MGAAVVNGKVYAIGGSATAFNEEYDPVIDKWTAKAPISIPTGYFAIAAYQNKIYCFGGITGPSDYGYTLTAANQVYDPITDKWETKAFMPTAKCYLQANVVNGKIYLIGGSKGFGSTLTNDVMVYDPETNSWANRASIPTAVTSYVSAVVGKKIYAITSSLSQIYDTEKDTWSLGTPPPSIIGGISSGGATSGLFTPQRIYMFGERASANYDPKTDSWSISSAIPIARLFPGVALLNDSFYVIGGFTVEAPKSPSSKLPIYFQPHTALSAVNEQYTPIGYGTPDPSITPPQISILSPENIAYNSSDISLNFTVNKQTNWLGYSLDSKENVTIARNITLSALSNGTHNVTVYANDTYGNTGASKTIFFTVNEPPSVTATETGIAIATIVGIAGGLVYVGKHKHFFVRNL